MFSPFLAGLAVVPLAAAFGMAPQAADPIKLAATIIAILLAFYLVIALIGVGYFAAYLRNAIDGLALGDLRFTLTARSMDWLKLFLGHALIVVATLGVGLVFISYRNWSFFIRHLEAVGEVDLDMLTQSTTDQSGDAEGLAAAFDIGAI